MQRPASTRKFSCTLSAWYFALGSPGSITWMLIRKSGKRSSRLSKPANTPPSGYRRAGASATFTTKGVGHRPAMLFLGS